MKRVAIAVALGAGLSFFSSACDGPSTTQPADQGGLAPDLLVSGADLAQDDLSGADQGGAPDLGGADLLQPPDQGSDGAPLTPAALQLSDGPSFAFGLRALGGITEKTFTLSNTGGQAATSISAAGLAAPFAFPGGGGYPGQGGTCGAQLAAGGSCTIVVAYAPNAAQVDAGVLSLSYQDGATARTVSVTLSGTGAPPASLQVSDGAIYDFGPVVVGASADKALTVTNTGGLDATSLVASAGLVAPFGYKGGTYPGVGGTCGASLGSMQACTVVVTFSPSQPGTATSGVQLMYSDGVQVRAASRDLRGTGTQPATLVVSDAPLYDFGTVAVGATPAHAFTITNQGELPATALAPATGMALVVPFAFKGGGYPGAGGTCGASLGSLASCTVVVEFAPTAPGMAMSGLNLAYHNGATTDVVSRTVVGAAVTGAFLAISDGPTYDFGTLATGAQATKVFTVTNTGALGATAIVPAPLSGAFAFEGGTYPGATGSCGASLSVAQSCAIAVTFTAPLGAASGTLSLGYDDGSAARTAQRPLVGAGTDQAFLVLSDGPAYDFGVLAVGASADKTFTLTNTGKGATSGGVAGAALSAPFGYKGGSFPGQGGSCSAGAPLGGGGSCTVVVTAAPAAAGATSGTLSVTYNDGLQTRTVARDLAVAARAPALLVVSDGPSYDFGDVPLGASAKRSLTVTNQGGVPASGIAASGLAAPFALTATCAGALGPGEQCAVTVTFAPSASGLATDAIDLAYHDGVAARTTTRGVMGTGVAPASLAISDGPTFDFGSRAVGSTSEKTLSVSNTGGVAATAMGATALPAPFAWKGGLYPGAGGTCGASLVAGATCGVVVTFAPTSVGAFSAQAQIGFETGAGPSSSSRALKGAGLPPAKLLFAGAGSYDFGTRAVGGTTAQVFSLTNGGSVTATGLQLSGLTGVLTASSTCGATLAAGASCAVTVTFAPDAAGAFAQALTAVYDDGAKGQSVVLSLSGKGAAPALLTISDAPLYDFGTLGVGKSADHIFVVRNTGGVSAGMIAGQPLAAPFRYKGGGGFPGAGGTCTAALEPGASCTIVASFAPTQAGAASDNLALTYHDGIAVTAAGRAIAGTGTVQAALAITDFPPPFYQQFGLPLDGPVHDFGQQGVGRSADWSFQVTNNGAGPATLIMPGAALGAGFAFAGAAGTFPGQGGTCTASLAVGATCTVAVTFKPPAAAAYSTTLELTYFDGMTARSASRALAGAGTDLAVVEIFDYGDPAGALRINLGPEWDFGTWGVGQSSTDHRFLVYNAGGAQATLAAQPLPAGFAYAGPTAAYPGAGGTCGATLAAGATCEVAVAFRPKADGLVTGALAIGYNDGVSAQSATRPMRGTGTSEAFLEVAEYFDNPLPSAYSFGTVAVGGKAGGQLRVRNRGAQDALELSPQGGMFFSVVGEIAFPDPSNCANFKSLKPDESCNLTVVFGPAEAKTYDDEVKVNYASGSTKATARRAVTGAGTDRAILTITEFSGGGGGDNTTDFGTIGVGRTSDRTLLVINTGAKVATLTPVGPSGAFGYPGGYPGATGVPQTPPGTCGSSLAPGQSCSVVVRFSPTLVGPASSVLQLDYADGGGSQSVARTLVGTGTDRALVTIGDYPDGGGGGDGYDYGLNGAPADHTFYVRNGGAQAATLADGGGLQGMFGWKGGTFPGQGGTCGTDPTTGMPAPLDAGQGCTVVVTFSPMGDGLAQGTIAIDFSDMQGTQTARRDVRGTATSRAQLEIADCPQCGGDPFNPINFGTSGQPIERTLYVRNRGQRPTSLKTVSITAPIFNWKGMIFPGQGGTCSLTAPIGAGQSCTVVVTFAPPPGSNNTFFGEVSLEHDDGQGLQKTARPLQAESSAGAKLEIRDCDECGFGGGQAPPYDFGTWGVPVDRTFTLVNVGGSAANNFTSPMPSNGTFRFKPMPGSQSGGFPGYGGTCSTAGLQPGQRCTIVVSFYPTAPFGVTVSANLPIVADLGVFATRTLFGTPTDKPFLVVNSNDGSHQDPGPYDYGVAGAPLDHTFFVLNAGGAVTTVGDAGIVGEFAYKGGAFPGGGTCTGAAATLAPGKSCTVIVSFTPKGSGARAGSFQVSSSASPAVAKALLGTATDRAVLVIGDYWDGFQMGGPYDFGASGIPVDHTFYVFNRGQKPVGVKDGGTLAGAFDFKGGAFPGQGGDCDTVVPTATASCKVVVTFTPGMVGGPKAGQLTLAYDDGLGLQAVSRDLAGVTLTEGQLAILDCPDCGLSGNPIEFGTSGIPVDRVVTLKNIGAQPTSFSTAPGLEPYFVYKGGSFPGIGGSCNAMLPASLSPGASCSVVITFMPPPTGGTVTGSLGFLGPPLFIPVTRTLQGTGANGPLVKITSFFGDSGDGPYDFGTRGIAQVRTLLASNVGNQPAVVSDGMTLDFTSQGFRYLGGTFPGTGGTCPGTGGSIGPGQSCSVVVEWVPSGDGPRSSTLSINYQDPAVPTTQGIATRLLQAKATSRAFVVLSDFPGGPPPGGDGVGAIYDYGTWGIAIDHTFYLHDVGGADALSIAASVALGDGFSFKGGAFPGQGGTCGAGPLARGASPCTVVVTFTPGAVGPHASTLTLDYVDFAGTQTTAPRSLTATATDRVFLALSEFPQPVFDANRPPTSFGTVNVGQSNSRTFYVYNTGKVSTSMLGGSAFPMGPSFALSGGFPGSGGTCGAVLAPSATAYCTVVVTFSPTASGELTDQLAVASDDGLGGPLPVQASRSLRGIGLSP